MSALMPDWLRQRARLSPDRPALIAGRQRVLFTDLDRRAELAGGYLAGLGVTAGARVALLLGNGIPFGVLIHALARLGAVAVPLNARLAAPELAWQLRDSRAAVLVHDEALSAAAVAAAEGLPGLVHLDVAGIDGVGRLSGARAGETRVPMREHVDLSAVQGIIYTSATSGRPKGVLLTYGNHWWSAVGSALNLGVSRDDCWLAALPLYHVGGLAILWRSVIYGIPAIIHERFDPDAVNREIEWGQVTLTSLVSTMLQQMLDAHGPRPYSSTLRCALVGGGPAPHELLQRCVALNVPVAPTYGLTEAASQVATLQPDEVATNLGSAGKPLFPTEVRVDAPGGEVGEILVRGPTVMAGYADRSEDTASVLHDGWLHTGDLGYLGTGGYLYVVDRREDLIISGGENVYPTEVETALREHPSVEDAGVIALPDATWGQVVAAAVKLRPGMPASEDDLKTFCASRVARYKVPRRIWFVNELPRASGGKLLRHTVRQWAEGRLDQERP
jgi:O-succinylbenzoic acid--CoA ligase